MNDFYINEYSFDESGKTIVSNEKNGKDWPVVYLIHNDQELYIGETQNVYKRFDQHLKNPERKNFTLMRMKDNIRKIKEHEVSAWNQYIDENKEVLG